MCLSRESYLVFSRHGRWIIIKMYRSYTTARKCCDPCGLVGLVLIVPIISLLSLIFRQKIAFISEVDVEGKIFLGGLTWQTTDDMLKAHFAKWGTLNDVILMRNKMTGEPRGFGFVQFTDSSGTVHLLLCFSRRGRVWHRGTVALRLIVVNVLSSYGAIDY